MKLSCAISTSTDRPPLHHILPCELRRQVSAGEALLGSVHYSPGFHVRGKVGIWCSERWKTNIRGGRDNLQIIIIIIMAALHGSRSNHKEHRVHREKRR